MKEQDKTKNANFLLQHTIELLESEFGMDFPLSSVLIFLNIPIKGQTTMTQLVKSSNLSPAGTSRTVATLAGYHKTNRRVLEHKYVTITDDPNDRRFKKVALTSAGIKLRERLDNLTSRYLGG